MQTKLFSSKNWLPFDWTKISENLLTILWQLLITTIVFYLIAHFGKKIIRLYLNRRKKNYSKRAKTVTALINSIFQYTVIFFYLFGVLSIVGVPVGTLLASAGIFSLALGMGAQGFVSDLVNGFFILSEDQFDVGDTVQINGQTGTVVQLGLRTTRLKANDDSIIYIPNRNISLVQNLAHGGIGLDLELQLNAANDFGKVTNLIKAANSSIKQTANLLVQQPQIIGITAQTAQTVTFTVHFQINPGKEAQTRSLYLEKYLNILQANQIKLAG